MAVWQVNACRQPRLLLQDAVGLGLPAWGSHSWHSTRKPSRLSSAESPVRMHAGCGMEEKATHEPAWKAAKAQLQQHQAAST